MQKKECRVCNKSKKLEKFVKLSKSEDGYTNICKKCHRESQQRYRSNNPDKYKSINLKSKYGITLEELEEMKEKQNGECLICQEKEELCIDHCHDDIVGIRGLICPSCNKGLGFFKDEPDRLHSAIKYLVRNGR